MLSSKTVLLSLVYFSVVFAAPVALNRREVPQGKTSLATNNPLGIVDPVFALLGNAAAQAGLGKLTDPDCLQQATADQAFTNAKAAGDVQGQVDALIFRALERNSGTVGGVTAQCTSVTAVNPEIAAIQQHQDPASTGAAATNKAIVLELAKQIAAVGGDPVDALKSGTFAPGQIGDSTGKGNTCDDANDANGCIFTQNLLVPDASEAEISAAVAGVAAATTAAAVDTATATDCPAATTSTITVTVQPTATATSAAQATCDPPVTVTVTGAAAATETAAAATTAAAAAATTAAAAAAASTAGNLQTFTGARSGLVGGATAPPVLAGGKGFVVDGSDFVNSAAALGRSCDVQHNACANVANSAAGRAASISVGQCDTQNTACHAAITA
ncbi:hypothetical protein C8J56DRAFT_880662 [Mycena floridula]|nr:hypothetical protein C8J56DRAFT_880662 [Mycena floridula]